MVPICLLRRIQTSTNLFQSGSAFLAIFREYIHYHTLLAISTTARQEDKGATTMTNQFIEDIVETDILYLVKDSKHDEEKPYELAYNAGGVIPQSNMSHEPCRVSIRNFRPLQNSESFRQFGFTSAKIDCALKAAEFYNERMVKDLYYPAIEKLLWQSFPDATAIRIIEHGVRIYSLPCYVCDE